MEETIEKSFNDLQVHKSLIKDSSFNSSIEFLENEIKIVNSSINQVGISISKIAKSLFEIKKLIKNNYWVKLTDSGIFNFSGRVCRDLALAHEKWLFNAKIPEYVLAKLKTGLSTDGLCNINFCVLLLLSCSRFKFKSKLSLFKVEDPFFSLVTISKLPL